MPDKVQSVLTVTSPAFEEGKMIPSKYTCDGENLSPGIAWGDVPEGTKSLVIIMEDPVIQMRGLWLYAWVHWIVYNIPSDVSSLPEAIPAAGTLESGARQGMTSFRRVGYGGPCPLFGTRRYYFQVYAVNAMVDKLEPQGATKREIMKAIEGRILAKGLLMGKYQRSR